MSTDFCKNIDIKKKIIKCVSLKEKIVFIFLNIYFLENNFKKGDKVTWYSNQERGYGTVLSIDQKNIEIKDDIRKSNISVPKPYVNQLHPLHLIIQKIEKNIDNKEKNKLKNISDKEIELFQTELNIKKENIIKELFPYINEGYQFKFIYDDTINDDDTNEIVLMKISQRCSSCLFEGSKYIFASYLDNQTNTTKAIGFNYDVDILSPKELLNEDICDLLIKEEDHTDDYENNIITHQNELLNLFENNKIKDNIIYFISLNDFIDAQKINELIHKDINCKDIIYELKPLKNRIINKYWNPLIKLELTDILGETENKKKEYEIEKIKLREYSFGNKIIYGSFNNINQSGLCDHIEISYFRINNKAPYKNNVDIYKLFSEFKLTEDVPFIKWVGSSYENKFYKIHKDSMIYEGYDLLKTDNKTIDINLCQEWTSDFYRNERQTLDNLNRFNNLHKTDVLFFKVCLDTQFIYSTLVIHLNGDIEFIIKKNKYDVLSILSKDQIKNLLERCNSIIETINNQNIYSDINITNFGTEKDFDELFKKETYANNIDFLDCNIYYNNDNYEVKKGIPQKDYDKLKKNIGFDPLIPPFPIGGRVGLSLPLLKNIMKNLPMFFRYMVENDKNGNDVLSCHYKRVNNYAKRSSIQSAIAAYSNIENLEPEEIINTISRDFGKEKEEIIQEYESWVIMNRRKKEENTLKKTDIIDEDGPNITITNNPSSLVFNIRDIKSFLELERLLIITKTLMDLFNNYINQSELFDNIYLRSYFEGDSLQVDDFSIEKKLIKKMTLKDLLESDDSSSEETSDESDESEESDESDESGEDLPSSDESDMEGGAGKYNARSYYLKRLKKNDPKLFVFKSEKYQIDRDGNKTNTRYGNPKI